jgi:hypothetical protein
MKRLLVIALSALMLSGCIAEWPSKRSGERWTGDYGGSGPAGSGDPVMKHPASPNPFASGRLTPP